MAIKKERFMSNYHPWRIALIVTPMFFVAGFLAVLGMKLANQLVAGLTRSEERRVGKECRSRWSPYH